LHAPHHVLIVGGGARGLKREARRDSLSTRLPSARACLAEFRERYNQRCPNWALVPEAGGDPWVPAEVYVQDKEIRIRRWQSWALGAKEKLEELMASAA